MNSRTDIQGHLLDFIYQFYNGMKSHEIIIAYEGDISHQLMISFASLIEERMFIEDEPSRVRQRVYHVLVECLQNISHHAFRDHTQPLNTPGRNVLLVTRTGEKYHVITGNPVQTARTNELKGLLDTINLTPEDKLDEMYKNQLINGKLSERGGAGLGFIDIRRKTGGPLEYHFLPAGENFSFFLLDTIISRKINP